MTLEIIQGKEAFGQLLQEMDELIAGMGARTPQEDVRSRLLDVKNRAYRIFSGMDRAIKALTAFYNVSRLLDTSAGIDAVLSYIVEGATDELGFERAILYTLSEDRKKLECRYLRGFTPEGEQRALSHPFDMDKHDCIETRVVKTGQELLVRDIENDPGLTPIDHKVTRYQRRKKNNLHVPIFVGGEVIGVLGVDKWSSEYPITNKDMQLLKFFAVQAGIVMENARLHGRNLQRIEQLIMLNEVGNRMRAADSSEKIVSIALEGLVKIVEAPRAVFLEYNKRARQVYLTGAKGLGSKERLDLCSALKKISKDWKPSKELPRRQLCDTIAQTADRFSFPLSAMVSNDEDLIGFILLDTSHINESTRELIEILSTTTAITLEKARLMGQVIAEKNKSESIINNYSHGIVTTDCRARVQTINPAARLILRLKGESLRHPVSSLFQDGELLGQLVEANLRRNEEIISKELTIRVEPGVELVLVLTIRSLILPSGVNSGSLIIFADVTENRKQKSFIHRLENLAALGKLSAAVAHEIRNPITGINVSLDVLRNRLADSMDSESKKLMEGARQEIARLERIVADLLNFARPERGSRARINLGEIIDNLTLLIRNQCERKNIQLEVRKNAAQTWLFGFDGGIKQALLNLVINAIQSMPHGGRLVISLDSTKRPQGIFLQIKITDSGQGIPEDIREKIFDPFFTTRKGGTGLGLAITRNIVDEHGGEISFVSGRGSGTCFTVILPKTPPSQVEPGRTIMANVAPIPEPAV